MDMKLSLNASHCFFRNEPSGIEVHFEGHSPETYAQVRKTVAYQVRENQKYLPASQKRRWLCFHVCRTTAHKLRRGDTPGACRRTGGGGAAPRAAMAQRSPGIRDSLGEPGGRSALGNKPGRKTSAA